MTSFTRMRWTGVDPRATPSLASGAQWARFQDLLAALEHERLALENARLGLAIASNGDEASLDPATLRRERRLTQILSNLKWMCLGGGLCWVVLLLLLL